MTEKNKTDQPLGQNAHRYDRLSGYADPSRARHRHDAALPAPTDRTSTGRTSADRTSAGLLPTDPEKSTKIKPKPKHDRPEPRRLRLLVLIRRYCPQSIHRPIVRFFRLLSRRLAVNSGDWHWMANNPLPLKSLNRNLWRSADPSFNYYVMLFLSGVISALGLLAGSTAAIIGAMIVAPLMGPITAMAFAITMGNRRLLKRSGLSVVTGALLTIGTAYFICSLVGLNTLNPEILERTRPTLIDLVIGLAAGAAGSFAKTRKEVADALPGVAIAVALVPPLSVIGIGLAYSNQPVVVGSTLLFLTNLSGIVLSGGLVFIWQDYGSIRRAKRGLTASTLLLLLLTFPLGLSMKELIIEERARSYVGSLIRRQTETFSSTIIRKLRVNSEDRLLVVDLEVAAPVGSISENQVGLVREFLEEKLERPIELQVKVFPVEEFSAQ
ncbi:MAG: TIGR00341 family protein [Cyanobacteria bacterium J06614_10]